MSGLSKFETQQTRLTRSQKFKSNDIDNIIFPLSLVVNSPSKIYSTDNAYKTNEFKWFAVSQS